MLTSKTRKVIHIDMDCFYAAVETKHNPSLRGKPVGIGGSPQSRSVLCTANYEARKFGVKAALPSSQAVRLCPELILIPPNFTLYKKESLAVREILTQYTDIIEPLSLDEAYLDVTNAQHFDGLATKIASDIRKRIWKELALSASAGIAPNKFLAKIASDWKKPNGQFVIQPQDIKNFMPGLRVEKIFGVGKVTANKMHSLGLFTCSDLQKMPLYELAKHFGRRARDLRDLAHGIDERPVQAYSERKSLTVEETYNKDLTDFSQWHLELKSLFQAWQDRMARLGQGSRIRSLVVKVKFFDFKAITRERAPQGLARFENFEELLLRIWKERPQPIRLLGLGAKLEDLTSPLSEADDRQLSLLDV